MATKTFKGRTQNKHDTEANWSVATNFKPLAGELIIYDKDNVHSTPRFKVGDGNTLVDNLPFHPSGDVTASENNTFTKLNKFTQKTTFNSGIYLGFTAAAPEVNDLWEIDKEGFKAAGKTILTQTIKFPDFSTFGVTTHTIPLNDTDNTFTALNTFNGGLKVPTTSTFNYGSKEESGVWFSVNEKADVAGIESASRTQNVSGMSSASMVDQGYIATGSFTPEGANPRDLSITVISGRSGEVSYNAAQDKIIWTVFTTSSNTLAKASVSYTSNDLITACAIVSHPKDSTNTEYFAALPDKSGTLALTTDIPAVKTEFFPIGYIYITTSSTSPAGTFGGTWERIKDKFLLAAGDTYTAGSTGGSADAVVVEHRHVQTVAPASGGDTGVATWQATTLYNGGNKTTAYTSYEGVNGAGKNLPPYLVVYVWKRIA